MREPECVKGWPPNILLPFYILEVLFESYESLVKASHPLPEEYMKEIALQASIWWQLMVFVKYLSFILKENCLACSTYIWGSYDQMPKM